MSTGEKMKTGYKETLKCLVKEHGLKLVVYVILVDVLDDILLPAILAFSGYPVLSGMAFIADLDWLTYPLYFVFATGMNKIKQIFKRIHYRNSCIVSSVFP